MKNHFSPPTLSRGKRFVLPGLLVHGFFFLAIWTGYGQHRTPVIPVGTLSAYPTVVQAGTHPTLTWSVTVPEVVSDIVTIENGGTIRAQRDVDADIRVLGSSVKRVWLNYRGQIVRSEWVPTEASVSKSGGSLLRIFYGTNARVVPNRIVYTTRLLQGETLNVAGRYSNSNGTWSTRYSSATGTSNIRALRNGDTPPTTTPLYQQPSLEAFLSPVLDNQGRIKIGPRDVVYLMELTHTNQSHGGYDLQDMALLVSFYDRVNENNGHGNNVDGVDSSNPGSSPLHETDTDPTVDDEIFSRLRGRRLR
ncbi:MAG: hypothetical protein NWR21_06380 [Verrucomicrobiales bacterium]|jgi:hypothetical protein|nr:hypothetical protein [Verrucomicrobiales bacterium]MDP4938924.1 hypothetical protein [Verrucomicrobiales bacterium]